MSLQVGLRTSYGSERHLSETGNHRHFHRALKFLRFGPCDQEEATIRHLQFPSHNLTLNSVLMDQMLIFSTTILCWVILLWMVMKVMLLREHLLNISEFWKFRFTNLSLLWDRTAYIVGWSQGCFLFRKKVEKLMCN